MISETADNLRRANARDISELGGDLGDISAALHAIQLEIDRGIEDGRSDQNIAQGQLGALSEAVRRISGAYLAWAKLVVGRGQ